MRNKKTFKMGIAAGMILPLLVFSVAFAETGMRGDDSGMMSQKSSELKANRMGRVLGMKKMMQNQIDLATRAIDRLDKIQTKIDERRAKLSDIEGVDLTEVDKLIADVEAQSVIVQTDLDKAKAALAAVKEDSEQPKQAVQNFMLTMRQVKKDLITLHKDMKLVVKAMRKAAPKGDQDEEEENSTTTNN